MQVGLALAGTLAGLGAWWRGSGLLWLAGVLLLFSVIPFTLVLVRPITTKLLSPGLASEAPETESLLRQWGALHVVRTLASGLAFALMLAALAPG